MSKAEPINHATAKEYATVQEAAQLAGVKVDTIRQRIKRNTLRAYRFGNTVLVRRNDVQPNGR